MKDIMLKITGRSVGTEADDTVEFVTSGRLFSRNGTTFISYEETDLSGMGGCTTNLSINKNRVKLTRAGSPLASDMVMEFTEGKRFEGLYETPYGPIGMEILTNKVSAEESSRISIDYNMSLKGLMQSRKLLNIEIIEKTGESDEQERTN